MDWQNHNLFLLHEMERQAEQRVQPEVWTMLKGQEQLKLSLTNQKHVLNYREPAGYC